MKKLALLLSMLISVLQAEMAFSYRPLVGSDWASHHQWQLPFSRCCLSNRAADEAGIYPWFGGDFFLGLAVDREGDSNFISCKNDDLGIAFSIPISLSTAFTFPSALIYKASGSKYTFSKSIDGKSMSDLLGTYWGLRVGIAAPIGGGAGRYYNSQGISLTALEGAVGLHAKAEISRSSLDPITPERQLELYKKYKSNPFVISGTKLASSAPRDIPSFLNISENGEANLKAKSGALLFIGTLKKGCKLSKDELKFNQGLDQAKLLNVRRDCSIVVELSDGSIVFQQHDGSNIVLSNSATEYALRSLKFVRSKHNKIDDDR